MFLSEVRFCTDPQPDFNSSQEVVFTTPLYNTIQPSADDLSRGLMDLVCTIASEGQYTWMWEKDNSEINNDDKYQITVDDGGRTTKLTIKNLKFGQTAVYTCTETRYNVHSAEYVLEYPGKVAIISL